MERKFKSLMKLLFSIGLILFLSCNSNEDNSFDSLSYSFEKWYFKNHPVEASLKSYKIYDDYFLSNDFKTKERYLLDMKRFYFELTQIDNINLSMINQFKYDRIKKILTKSIYLIEKVKVDETKPSMILNEIKFGLLYLVNYNSSMQSIQKRLNQIKSLLSNSLINITNVSDGEYKKCQIIIDDIILILENIQLNLDFKNDFYSDIVDISKKNIQEIKKYKNNLKSMKSQYNVNNNKLNLDNLHFKTITDTDYDLDVVFKKAKKTLSIYQKKIFNNTIDFFLKENDEPVWVDYDDTLYVINYVVQKIKNQNKIENFKYVQDSYEKFGLNRFLDINFSYYDNSFDYFYLIENLSLIIPHDSNKSSSKKISVNLPKSPLKMLNVYDKKKTYYNEIQIDLLNAYKFYPGEHHIFNSSSPELITNRIPNKTTLRGLQRYAERVFIKTNKKASLQHQIIHEYNIINDICKCIVDNEYHIKNKNLNKLLNYLQMNCFMNEYEAISNLDFITSSIFGESSTNFIGISKILEIEQDFIGESKNYLKFYNKYLVNGVLELENLHKNFQ